MIKRTELYFRYPENLNILDLANLVNMYRSRGEPRKAPSGEYFLCNITNKLIKEAKWWFGIYYSQSAWDMLITKNSGGYPLTEAEMNILGLALEEDSKKKKRDFIEKNSGALPQLSFMIINDLKQFGFLKEDENACLYATEKGDKALNGICRRIYEKKYVPEMLYINQVNLYEPTVTRAEKSSDSQINLF